MDEVAGCGIDIEEICRFANKLPSEGSVPGFSEMIYTADEIAFNLSGDPGIRFPLGFSCKEAFFKAFGVSWMNGGISWKDIELLFPDNNDMTSYKVRLNGYAQALFEEMKCVGFESHLEYNDEFVVFQVVLLS